MSVANVIVDVIPSNTFSKSILYVTSATGYNNSQPTWHRPTPISINTTLFQLYCKWLWADRRCCARWRSFSMILRHDLWHRISCSRRRFYSVVTRGAPERGLSANVPVSLTRRVRRIIVDRATLQRLATWISVRPHPSIAKARAQTSLFERSIFGYRYHPIFYEI